MPTTTRLHTDPIVGDTAAFFGSSDFAYATALLPHQGLNDIQLDALDVIADAAEAARKLLAHLGHMQLMIEQHANPYDVKQQFAVDLEIAGNAVRRHTSILLGVDGALS